MGVHRIPRRHRALRSVRADGESAAGARRSLCSPFVQGRIPAAPPPADPLTVLRPPLRTVIFGHRARSGATVTHGDDTPDETDRAAWPPVHRAARAVHAHGGRVPAWHRVPGHARAPRYGIRGWPVSAEEPPPDAAIRDQLAQALREQYVVEREIGGSGMSRVFIAHEAALGRKVVIKVLTPELASEISAERFAREIRLAASLQQANIVPLLAAGSAAGLPYYTMPLVEGRSLRDRLARDGALPVGEGMSILRDIARALAYAHAHGVVHRDIKPGNVLLSGGTAVVTDFGIAKALGEARDADAQSTLTRTGMAIGTPAYMAPEQATGDPNTDHRADLYAFGCLAYEIFAGTPPFQRSTAHELIAAHITVTPPPVSSARREVPAPVSALIAQCLEKHPAKRPASAEDLLASLDGVTPQPVLPYRRRRRGLVVGGAALVVAVVGAIGYARYHAPPDPLTVDAIPFLNLAHDTTLQYLSSGISDELLTGLRQVSGIRIINRQMAYRYQGRSDIDVRTVARDLGVRCLITGTLREAGGTLTISAQLNDGQTGGELWAQTFAFARNDLGSTTGDIVRTLSDTLRARFPETFRRAPRPPRAPAPPTARRWTCISSGRNSSSGAPCS